VVTMLAMKGTPLPVGSQWDGGRAMLLVRTGGARGACGISSCVSTNGCRCKTKLSHVMLLIRQCHVVNTPRAVCFVLKLAQASLGVLIEGSECFGGVQNRSFSFDHWQSRCAPLSPSPSPGRPMPPSPQSAFLRAGNSY
jgi:hypothetical protein